MRTTSLRNRSELISEGLAVTTACPSSYKPKGEALSELISKPSNKTYLHVRKQKISGLL